MKISVLDQSPIGVGDNASHAISQTIELAQHCDELGYHRYWLAEHHNSKTLASCAPEILIARVARETERIRVGSGGVMLSHYSPYKIAENFKLLEAMYPGRIDLGVGRAPGSDGITAAALAYGNKLGIEYYPTKIKDLLAWISEEKPYSDAFGDLQVSPSTLTTPELWVLASSRDSAMYAAHFGLPLSFAHFISPTDAAEIMQSYRDAFAPGLLKKPKLALGVFAIITNDDEKADLMRKAREIQRINREKGIRKPAPTLDQAKNYPFTTIELEGLNNKRSRQIIGSPEDVRKQIDALVKQTFADEVIVLTITSDFNDRLKSYELLSKSFQLSA